MLCIRPLFSYLAMLCVVVPTHAALAADEPATPEPAPEPVQTEHPVPATRSDTIAAELKRQLPASEFVNLNAADEDFVALWQPANDGNPKGVVILLPGEGESADWPRGIGPLRRGLPDHGWHTLSLSLPDARVPAAPVTTITAEPAADPAAPEQDDSKTPQPEQAPTPNEAGYLPETTAAAPETTGDPADEPDATDASTAPVPPIPQAERVAKRIEAALAFARSKQPAAIVLLGHGSGAYWGAQFLQQQGPPGVTRLVMVQPRQPDGQDEPLAQLVAPLKLPTGDFYYKEGPGNLSAARDRLNASRRNRHPSYGQVALPPQTGDRQVDDEQLLRRVRGWLAKKP